MKEQRLLDELRRVAARFEKRRERLLLAAIWLSAAVVGCLLLWIFWNAASMPYWLGLGLLLLTGLTAIIAVVASRRRGYSLRFVARRIEARFPELDARLFAAVEQQRDQSSDRLGYLQATVIDEALRHGDGSDWRRTLPDWRLRSAGLASAASLIVFLVVIGAVLLSSGSRERRVTWLGGPVVPLKPFAITVEPGDTELERGSSLLVVARFDGDVPDDVSLVYELSEGDNNTSQMSRSLDDPLFGGRIPAVAQALTYRVQYDGQQTRPYEVSVFDYPRLDRADARLRFPSYTGLEETAVEDTRHLSAVEGTQLTLICRLNKPVAQAQLRARGGTPIPLTAEDTDPLVYQAQWTLAQSARLTLHLTDHEGRANKEPPEFVINVTRNKPPDLKLTAPGRDLRVSPLEELQVAGTVWDDFGIDRFGMSFSLGGDEPREVPLGEDVSDKKPREVAHLLALEELEAQPDQLIAYHFWAEDRGPDGNARRTLSDMYFAEVRHFEEIFRQGQQPPGGAGQQQGGGNQAAEELAELQKQIVTATWNILRQADAQAADSRSINEDAGVVEESQRDALEQASALGEKLQDPESLRHLEQARQSMQQAVERLQEIEPETPRDGLADALSAEQAAYQALLKLRAREFEVTRGNQQQQGGGGGSAASRSQEQLQQVELKDDQNLYETQRAANSAQGDPAEREVRQALSRLKELARRQEDLNEQIKDLESALKAAQTEQEREEVQRQLKRLRDQQEQILRDVDELRNRMDQPQNQQRMAEARQQLEETRSSVRQSSEALQQGQLSQALSAGTRAERELNELEEQFRQQTANRFSEQMQEMRRQAQEIDQRQEAVSEQIEQLSSSQSQSLRGSPRAELDETLRRQQEELEQLLAEMRDVVQASEESEPLLSRQLYDAIRKTNQEQPLRSLEATRQMVERGFVDEALREEAVASQSISQLREAVERAAESVVGDEAEALQRAREELAELTEQLEREIARHTNQQQPAGGAANDDTGYGMYPVQTAERREDDSQVVQASGEQAESSKQEVGQQPGAADQPVSESSQEGQPGASQTAGQSPPPPQSPSSQPGANQQAQSQSQSPSPSESPAAGSSSSSLRGPRQPSESSSASNASPGSPTNGNQRNTSTGGGGGFDFWLSDGDFWEGPVLGEEYRQWSDRLRDVEEIVSDPELRAEAARIRDRMRGVRQEIQRHAREPNWPLIQESIAEPLAELHQRITEEILRRQSKDALVPIDRDPVPPEYEELVRRYYENLGAGE